MELVLEPCSPRESIPAGPGTTETEVPRDGADDVGAYPTTHCGGCFENLNG